MPPLALGVDSAFNESSRQRTHVIWQLTIASICCFGPDLSWNFATSLWMEACSAHWKIWLLALRVSWPGLQWVQSLCWGG
jgi:hypothetical protein